MPQITRSQVRNHCPPVDHNFCSKAFQLDQSSVATYTPQTDGRSTNLSSTNTPQSDYGITPTSARSSGFPDPLARYGPYPSAPSHHPGAVATMAQPNSPSMSLPDGGENNHRNSNTNSVKSNSDVPIDPSISQASPTYPPPQYPYPPPGQHMSPYGDQNHPAMYGRPDWPYGQHPGMQPPYGHPPTSQPPPQQNAQRPGQVRNTIESNPAKPGLMTFSRCIRLSRYLVPSSTSAPVADMRRLRECTNVGGMVVRKHTAPSIT